MVIRRVIRALAIMMVGLGFVLGARLAQGATLEESWEALGSKEAKTAEEAEIALRGQGEAAGKFVTAKLTVAPEAKEVGKLIRQLDDEQFKVRDAAQARLLSLGTGVGKMLQDAMSTAPSPESAARLQTLVDKLRGMRRAEGDEGQRQTRGVRIVELSGAGAEALLRKIGVAGTWESTRDEAMSALFRRRVAEAERMLDEVAKLAAARKDTTEIEAALEARLQEAGLLDQPGVRMRVQRVADMKKLAARRMELEAKLREKPEDAAVREALVTLLLIDMNDPGAAQKAMNGAKVEAALARAVTLAARPLESLTTEEREELARFYIVAAKVAEGAGKATSLDRAGTLLALCLADSTLNGEQAARLKNELAAVQADLEKLDAGEGGWIDGLPKADLSKDTRGGQWGRDQAEIRVKADDFAILKVALKMPENYELKVRLTRRDGSDGVFVGFPVGSARADLNLGGWGNSVAGLEVINGRAVVGGDPAVKRSSGLENGKSYEYLIRVRVNVDGANIVVTENGKPLAKWNGPPSALSCDAAWHPEEQTGVGLGAYRSEVVFERVQMRKLDAE